MLVFSMSKQSRTRSKISYKNPLIWFFSVYFYLLTKTKWVNYYSAYFIFVDMYTNIVI